MNLNEANTWLKNPITEEQLEKIIPLYYVLDFPAKEDFCKVIDAVGIGKVVSRKIRYDRLLEAEKQLTRKEQHKKDLERLEALYDEREELEKRIGDYRSENNL